MERMNILRASAIFALLFASRIAECEDLKEHYLRCLKTPLDGGKIPVETYRTCLEKRSFDGPFVTNCKITSDLYTKCILELAGNAKFADCIGDENLKGLNVVVEINKKEAEVDCTKETENIMGSKQECGSKYYPEFTKCHAKYNFYYPDKNSVESMSGFSYTKENCQKWMNVKKCYIDAISDCKSEAIEYSKKQQEAYWSSTPCPQMMSNGSEKTLPVVLVIMAFIISLML